MTSRPVARPRAIPTTVSTSTVLPLDQTQHAALRQLAAALEAATGSHQATMVGIIRVAATEADADVRRAAAFAEEVRRRTVLPAQLLAEILLQDGALPWIPTGSQPGDTPAATLHGGLDPVTWVRRACDRRYGIVVDHVAVAAPGTERGDFEKQRKVARRRAAAGTVTAPGESEESPPAKAKTPKASVGTRARSKSKPTKR